VTLLLAPFLILVVGRLGAHELEVRVEATSRPVVIRSTYAGTEPCAYAAVTVFGPGDTKNEHQNGRTDAQGYFSFVPDRPGQWRFIVDDELGHRRELPVLIADVHAAANQPAQADRGGAMPTWQKGLTGGALIVGLTGLLYGWKTRRAQ